MGGQVGSLVVADVLKVEGWCMHSQPPAGRTAITEGTLCEGVVVCVHRFGVGVYLPSEADFGHVDVPFLGAGPFRDLDDYPVVGSFLSLQAVGRNGFGQLRLHVLP